MREFEVSAPGKLMLFGEHAVVYGRASLVTAVDQRIRVSASGLDQDKVIVHAPDVGLAQYEIEVEKLGKAEYPKEVKFALTAVANFLDKYKLKSGLLIKTKSDFSSKFGFGSSSAVTVCVIRALSELFDKKMTEKETFLLAYKTVLDVQGVGSGFDLAAAIWGGTVYFVTGGKKIEQLSTSELPLVVGYTGVKADTVTLVKSVATLRDKNPGLVDGIFDLIALGVKEAKVAIKEKDYGRLGELMNVNQGLLDSLGVGSAKLSVLIHAARGAGAYGAKLSGAGGGDCMIALVAQKNRKAVERAIEKAGGEIMRVRTNAEGLRIEK